MTPLWTMPGGSSHTTRRQPTPPAPWSRCTPNERRVMTDFHVFPLDEWFWAERQRCAVEKK